MDFYFCYLNNHRAIRQNNTVTAVNTLQTITKITFRYSFSEKTYKRCISPQEKFPKRYSKKQMIQRKRYKFGAILFFFFFLESQLHNFACKCTHLPHAVTTLQSIAIIKQCFHNTCIPHSPFTFQDSHCKRVRFSQPLTWSSCHRPAMSGKCCREHPLLVQSLYGLPQDGIGSQQMKLKSVKHLPMWC